MMMPGRQYTSSEDYRHGYNGQEKSDEISGKGNHNTATYWEYDTRLGRRWNLDPKPTLSVSQYASFNNNPMYYSDPYGDTIRIKSGDGYINYSVGMKYDGDDKFASTVIESLNKLNTIKGGKIILEKLSSSENHFDFINEFEKDSKGKPVLNALALTEDPNGCGGIIRAAAVMSETMDKPQKIGTLGHELFHAYQTEMGVTGATVNREVGAYLFERSIMGSLQAGIPSFGNSTPSGQLYEKAMTGLLYGTGFNLKLYKSAIQTFKKGSVANRSGTYNKFKIIPNDADPLIKSFYPLLPE